MYNHHKRLCRGVRKYKKQNFNKAYREKIGGTGTLPNIVLMYGIAPFKQCIYDNELPNVIQTPSDVEQINYDLKEKGLHITDVINVPREWRTHDRTRWDRNKRKTKQLNRDRKIKMDNSFMYPCY